MEPVVKKMEATLKRWSLKIDQLAAKTQVAGVHAGFDAITYLDELKALHAVAQSRFNEFRAVEDWRNVRMLIEMKSAMEELDAAFKKRAP